MNKYIDIKNDCTRRFRHCKKIFIEMTSPGLVTTHIENLNSIFKEQILTTVYEDDREVHGSGYESFVLYLYTLQ